jgi:hypothetical protein
MVLDFIERGIRAQEIPGTYLDLYHRVSPVRHTKIESTVRYLRIGIDKALAISGQTDV